VKKEKQDVDIFVVFKTEKDLVKLEKLLDKAKYESKVVHGSRDYFHIDMGFCVLEIIPVLEIKKPELAKNVTDVSLMHVKYVTKKIKENPKIVDEIILAKAFCAANNVYGAESYISGFSGYSLEVLVSYFGSFVKFLKSIDKRRVIDPEKYFKNESEILRELNSSKLGSPVVLIDPTYKYRNVCAGLSEETFKEFLEVAKEFLKKPSEEFFVSKEFSVDDFKKLAEERDVEFVELHFETDRQEGDIAGTKMKKFFGFIVSDLNRKGQEVLEEKFVYKNGQNARGYLIVKENKERIFEGPDKIFKEGVKSFKKVHKKSFEKKGKLFAYGETSLNECLLATQDVGLEMGVSVGF
jgi:tRNA nucleotidyltransferase (CCA-adding enzyme)